MRSKEFDDAIASRIKDLCGQIQEARVATDISTTLRLFAEMREVIKDAPHGPCGIYQKWMIDHGIDRNEVRRCGKIDGEAPTSNNLRWAGLIQSRVKRKEGRRRVSDHTYLYHLSRAKLEAQKLDERKLTRRQRETIRAQFEPVRVVFERVIG